MVGEEWLDSKNKPSLLEVVLSKNGWINILESEVSNLYVLPCSSLTSACSTPSIKYFWPDWVTIKVWSWEKRVKEKRKKKMIETRKCRRVVIPVVNTVWCGFNSFNKVTLIIEFIWFLKLFSGSITIHVKLCM